MNAIGRGNIIVIKLARVDLMTCYPKYNLGIVCFQTKLKVDLVKFNKLKG